MANDSRDAFSWEVAEIYLRYLVKIEIDPGEKLHLDITMQIQLDLPDTQDNIILSFNPGMNVHLLRCKW